MGPFSARDVIEATGIPERTANNFLRKHRVGNPDGETEHYIRVCCHPRRLYRLKRELPS